MRCTRLAPRAGSSGSPRAARDCGGRGHLHCHVRRDRLIAPGQARVKAVTGRDLLIRGGGRSRSRCIRDSSPTTEHLQLAGRRLRSAGDGKAGAVQLDLLPLLSGRYEVTRLELVNPSSRWRPTRRTRQLGVRHGGDARCGWPRRTLRREFWRR